MKFDEKYQKILVLILLLLASFYFLYVVRSILFPFLIAGIIAYLANPLIEKLLKRGFNRLGAILLLFGMLMVIALIFGVFGLPLIVEELNNLSRTLPEYVNKIEDNLDKLYHDLERVKMPAIVKQVADETLDRAEQAGVDFLKYLTDLIFNSLSHVISLITAPIIAFYILKDLEMLTKSVEALVPKKYRKDVFQLWVEINAVFSGFMRGQFLVAIFIAVLTTLGLVALQVNFAVVLGAVAGVFNIIPYLGPILGAIPAVAIVLIKSPVRALGVVILFVVIQQIESGFVSPKIVGKKVGLHPITVIFVVLAGGKIGGVFGMILAVPIAGIVKVIFKFVIEKMVGESRPQTTEK